MDFGLPKSGYTRDYRIVLVGHRYVGKSAIVVRFLTKRFISEYQENFDMTCSGVAEVDGDNIQLNICDTSEKGLIPPHMDGHFRWADAVMLVYSITDEKSFTKLSDSIAKIKMRMHANADNDLIKVPAIVVVGNKGDLDHLRQVPRAWGHNMASQLGCQFFETSASEGWSKIIESPLPSPENAPTIHRHAKLRHVNSTELMQTEVKTKTVEKPTDIFAPKNFTQFRRKSAPMGNTILSIKSNFSNSANHKNTKGKENNHDSDKETKREKSFNDNNNNSVRMRRCPPLVAVPINQKHENITSPIESEERKRSGSIGKKFIKKLSPHLPRKRSTAPNLKPGLTRHSESVARGLMSVGAFTLGTLVHNESSPTLSKTTLGEGDSSSSGTDSPKKPAQYFLTVPSSDPDLVTTSSSEEDLEITRNFCNMDPETDSHTTLKTKNVQIPKINLQRPDVLYNKSTTNLHTENPVIIKLPRMAPECELAGRQVTFSEPFKFLCREIKTNRRSKDRSKSPSQFVKIRNGIRRIKTFAAEQHNLHHHHSVKPSSNTVFQTAAVRP